MNSVDCHKYLEVVKSEAQTTGTTELALEYHMKDIDVQETLNVLKELERP